MLKRTTLTALLLAFNVSAQELNTAQIEARVQAYAEAKQAKQQPDATMQNVEAFIALFADEFIDEHVKFDVVVTSKEELRKGLEYKLKDKVFFNQVEVIDLLIGRNVAFVELREEGKVQPQHLDKEVEYQTSTLVSMEFNDDGQIIHLRRFNGLNQKE